MLAARFLRQRGPSVAAALPRPAQVCFYYAVCVRCPLLTQAQFRSAATSLSALRQAHPTRVAAAVRYNSTSTNAAAATTAATVASGEPLEPGVVSDVLSFARQ